VGASHNAFSPRVLLLGFAVRPCLHDVFIMKRMFDSTAGQANTERRAHTVPTSADLRRHRTAVVTWALTNGDQVSRDSLAVIISAASQLAPGQVSLHWTGVRLDLLLQDGFSQWCSLRGVQQPIELSQTLTTYLRYLSAHRLLDADSDDTLALQHCVAEFEKLQKQQIEKESSRVGSRSRHPTSQPQFLAPVLPLY